MNLFSIKKIDKLLLRSFITTYIYILILALFILVIHSFFLLFNHLAGKGLGAIIYIKLLFYLSLDLFPKAFPIAIVFTALMVFGTFSESCELTAMRAMGLSLQRLLQLPFTFVFILSGWLFYFQDYIHPTTKPKIFALYNDIINKKADFFIQEDVICNNIPGYSIHVEKKLNNQGHIQGITIYDYTKSYGTVSITTAEKGKIYTTPNKDFLVLSLTNGHNYIDPLPDDNAKNPSFYRTSFLHQKLQINLSALKLGNTDAQFEFIPPTRTHPQLQKLIKSIQERMVTIEDKSKKLLSKQLAHYAPIAIETEPLAHTQSTEVPPTQEQTASPPPPEDNFTLFRKQCGKHPKPTALPRVIWRALFKVEQIQNTLTHQINYKKATTRDLNSALYTKECRLAAAIRCIIMFLLAASLGCMIRKGGFGISTIVSAIILLLEYILSEYGEEKTLAGDFSPFIGAWLANFILLGLCPFFFIKSQQGIGMALEHFIPSLLRRPFSQRSPLK